MKRTKYLRWWVGIVVAEKDYRVGAKTRWPELRKT